MIEATDYRITVQRRDTEDGRLFEGSVNEFPDIAVFGETPDEAYAMAIDAVEALTGLLSDQGRPIPEPAEPEQEYSGKFIVRTPKWVHRDLVVAAADQGTSLNQYIVSVLSAHTVVTKPAAEYAIQMAVLPLHEPFTWQSSASLTVINSTARLFGSDDEIPGSQRLKSNVISARKRA